MPQTYDIGAPEYVGCAKGCTKITTKHYRISSNQFHRAQIHVISLLIFKTKTFLSNQKFSLSRLCDVTVHVVFTKPSL